MVNLSGAALHILPKGFVRIRHYGMLSSYHKKLSLGRLKATLAPVVLKGKTPLQHRKCPTCKIGHLTTIATLTARGSPPYWSERQNKPQLNKRCQERKGMLLAKM
jgi:hypothetical protein